MDPCYMGTFLECLSIASYFRFMCLNKKVRSYPFIVNFFQNGELSLSLRVLKPLYTFETYAYIFSPRSLRKGHWEYGEQLTMFTMLIFVLSFKDCKCFLYSNFGYFVTIEFYCVLLKCWLAPCSSHCVLCVYFSVFSLFYFVSLLCLGTSKDLSLRV